VMGLNEMLQPFFDKIEGGSGRDELKQNIEAVKNICQKAVQEAKDFLQAMPA